MIPIANISIVIQAAFAIAAISSLFINGEGVADELKPGYARPKGGVLLSPGNGDLKVGPGMDASQRSLYGCEFNWTDLTGANFEGSDLSGLKIDNCNLKDASFRGASLTGFFFYSGNIDGADFTGATINGEHIRAGVLWNLRLSPEQFMSTASYKKKNLKNCVIPGYSGARIKVPRYDFRDADLSGAAFGSGNFSECDFTNARLDLTDFGNAEIRFDTLSTARPFQVKRADGRSYLNALKMYSARIFGDCDFSGMRLIGVHFSAQYSDSVNLTDAILEDCYFLHINSEHLMSTRNHQQGELSGLRFRKCDFSGCDFSGRDLAGSSFKQCDFTQARFTDAVISRVEFADPATDTQPQRDVSTGLTADHIRSTWNYKHGRMHGIVLPVAVKKALDLEKE